MKRIEEQIVIAQEEIKKPFDKEKELTEKTIRLNMLNGMLNVDRQGNELVDMVEDAVMPQRTKLACER